MMIVITDRSKDYIQDENYLIWNFNDVLNAPFQVRAKYCSVLLDVSTKCLVDAHPFRSGQLSENLHHVVPYLLDQAVQVDMLNTNATVYFVADDRSSESHLNTLESFHFFESIVKRFHNDLSTSVLALNRKAYHNSPEKWEEKLKTLLPATCF
jgi:hypothetical protein